MKSWHVTVMERKTVDGKTSFETLFQKKCITVAEANDLFKGKKFWYYEPQYMVLRESF